MSFIYANLKRIVFIVLLCLSQIVLALPMNFPFETPKPGVKIAYRAAYSYPDSFDPIRAYDDESNFYLSQIYESLYNVSYWTSDFSVTPLLAEKMPTLRFYDVNNHEIDGKDYSKIAKTIYRIPLRHGIYYSPNPYFCGLNEQNECHFKREMRADDFVYALSRVVHKGVQSPFIAILRKHLYRFADFYDASQTGNIDFKLLSESIRAIDDYTLEIVTIGYYAQWMDWLRMLIFSPIPREIGDIYDKTNDQTIWLKHSIGTGPMMYSGEENIQKLRLIKNPHYRLTYFHPQRKDKILPMLDEIQFFVEKEAIPRWNKFLQGYYDLSSIPAESFENTVQIGADGNFKISPPLQERGIKLKTFASMSSYVLAFNMLDPILGGTSSSSRLLRQAISIAIDYQEFVAIFFNGRGRLAQGPVPPELLDASNRDRMNPYVYQNINHHLTLRSLKEARDLMIKAGYPNGIDPKTHRHLRLNLDIETKGSPEEKARLAWFHKQFAKLGISLNFVESDANRYKQKLYKGEYQMVFFGWNADYPDAENFLMLFYSKNAQVNIRGSNVSNFSNKRYDKLFEQLQHENVPENKHVLIAEMIDILRYQCVQVWGTFGLTLYLVQKWLVPVKYSPFTHGLMQYINIHPDLREKNWNQLNRVELIPLLMFIMVVFILLLPIIYQWLLLQKAKVKRYTSARKQC